LRILDSKDAADRAIVAAAPVITPHLTEGARQFWDGVRRALDAFAVPFVENPRIVRGLDYYSHTAFEFVTDALGAQGTVLAGGRYDGLVAEMGGPPTPAVGWAAGIDRLALLLEESPAAAAPIALIPLGEAAEHAAIVLLQRLRHHGIRAEIAYRGTLKKRLERANRIEATHAIIVGDAELAHGVVQVKDLAAGTQREVNTVDLPQWFGRCTLVDLATS
jgi:histidyl-tRNA synthetase